MAEPYTPPPHTPATAQELVWLDPRSAARIRKKAAWRALLDEAADPSGVPALPNQKASPDDRREISLILARGAPADADGVAAARAESIRDDGKYTPPLLLVAGELTLPFDELATLKATVTAATPFTGGDDPLRAAVSSAEDFLKIPGLLPSPAVTDALVGRIRDAFGRVKRAVPAGYLETQTERALLEQRCYQKRKLAGDPHLRALLQPPGDRGTMLAFLPATLADKLPLQARLGVRAIVEVHLLADQIETHPFALAVLALSRLIPPPRRA